MTTGMAGRLDDIQQLLDEFIVRQDIPGAQMALLDGDEVWEFAAGVRDVEARLPVTTATLFPYASITKVFTIVLLEQLVEEGLVSLDAPVHDYLTDVRLPPGGPGREVSLRQALAHTSGLDGIIFDDVGEGDDALARYISLLPKLSWLCEPGLQYSLCSSAFLIGARVIEVLTGETWEGAMSTRVLHPLGLKHIRVWRDEVARGEVVRGHLPSEEGPDALPLFIGPRATAAAGAMFGTAGDVLRLARAYSVMHPAGGNGRAVGARAAVSMLQPSAPLADLFWSSVGLGWFLGTWRRPIAASLGSYPGQECFLRIVPDTGRGLAFMANSWTGYYPYFDPFPRLCSDLLDIERPAVPTSAVEVDIGLYEGVYTRASVDVRVERDGDRLLLSTINTSRRGGLVTPLDRVPLTPVDETRFTFQHHQLAMPTSVSFLFPDHGGRAEFVHFWFQSARRTMPP